MNTNQMDALRKRFSLNETEELLEIWSNHNTSEWTLEAFEAIHQVLTSRNVPVPVVDDQAAADRHLDLAESFISVKQYENALKECDLAILAAPHYAEAHYLKGICHQALGQMDAALESLENAVHFDPNALLAQRKRDQVKDTIKFGTISTEDRILGAINHIGIIMPVNGCIISIIILLIKRKESRFINFQCLQAITAHVIVFLSQILFITLIISSVTTMGIIYPAGNPQTNPVWVILFAVVILLCFMIYLFLLANALVAAISSLQGKNF